MRPLPAGIYDRLIDRDTRELLEAHPELRSVLKKIDAEEVPARFAAFVADVVEKALQLHESTEDRLKLCNEIIGHISASEATAHLDGRHLSSEVKNVLAEVTPAAFGTAMYPRPATPIWESSLFTGATTDPRLDHELVQEIHSADRIDFLVAFIRWSGLRLLRQALEDAVKRGIRVRVITTSYMGASESRAVEWLASLPNVEIKVSYDTDRTRLHAKAYHFHRESGFSTAYIGSANLSEPALTSGLEWNLKITNQDLPHILEKFLAEFETYWNSHEFVPFDPNEPGRFREAISSAKRRRESPGMTFFADLRPHPFQERILESLKVEREVHGHFKNLIVAATGTGKTVVSAFDYARFRREAEKEGREARLLFVAHRKEILEQSVGCFRAVLRDINFGELQVDQYQAANYDHLFCSNLSLRNLRLWEKLGPEFFDFIIVDEVHHGAAESYRDIFEQFRPKVLLGLTATPERMDGKSILDDFGGRFAAEIRLPDALEEKLLCPFHYFAVSDPVSLADNRFWSSGKYEIRELENVYTGHDLLAKQRVNAVLTALDRYHGDHRNARAVGFCVSVKHAEYMADCFSQVGIPSRALTGQTDSDQRAEIVGQFRAGDFAFLFVVDIFNEGVDIPDIDTVLFLRPTESLTIFLQQLGRGLRHAPEKDCLTVIDLVGQMHQRYRIDRKFAALLPNRRFRIDREVAADFPHLPAGSSIILEKQARKHVIASIERHYANLQAAVVEDITTFEHETRLPLTFGNFIKETGYQPHQLLGKKSWSEWKHDAGVSGNTLREEPGALGYGITRTALLTAPRFLETIRSFADAEGNPDGFSEIEKLRLHYLLRQKSGTGGPHQNVDESLREVGRHPNVLADLREVGSWAKETTSARGGVTPETKCWAFELHGTYTTVDINVILGSASFTSPGQIGVGVVHFREQKTYALLMTFQKSEKDFSPSTMYQDYPVSRELIHWQSQNNTTLDSQAGRHLTRHDVAGYTILVFARLVKQEFGVTMPFIYLGPAGIVDFHGERPITCHWKLDVPMPWDLYQAARVGG
jgi:superfamily II DNA or RNA helicase/HKD family nuclease